MMHVLIPIDKEIKYLECKKLYEQNKVFVNDDATFDEVINNTLFYSFYENEKLTLCVYFFEKNGKLWVNGFGKRKHHLFNKECFKLALTWFNTDIWAFCPHRPAAFGLLSCGFKKYKKNLYRFKNKCNT